MTLGNGTTTSYGYGNQGTLSTLTHDLAGTAQDQGYTYTCNQVQEIVGHSWSNDLYQWLGATNGTQSYTTNGLNQYTAAAGATLSYDTKGNLTGDGVWTYTFDTDNKLKAAAKTGYSATLAYDAEGRLRRTVLDSVTTDLAYDGTDLVAEYDGAGAVLRRYVHGPGVDEPLVWYEGSGTVGRTWLYADQSGSVVGTANSAGTSTAVHTYGPFGEPNVTTGVRFRYTGQQYLGGLNLYYYKARFYSPALGRFLQTDPIGTRDDLNLYIYARNDPINLADPTGECPSCIGALIGAGIDLGVQLYSNGGSLSQISWTSVGVSAGLGAVGNFAAGRATSAFLKVANNSSKGVIGEVGAATKGLSQGRVVVDRQVKYGLSKSYTRVDQIQRNVLTGERVLVEAKYASNGRPSLSSAQRRAVNELPARGLDYRVVVTTLGEVVNAARGAGSVAGGLAGSYFGVGAEGGRAPLK